MWKWDIMREWKPDLGVIISKHHFVEKCGSRPFTCGRDWSILSEATGTGYKEERTVAVKGGRGSLGELMWRVAKGTCDSKFSDVFSSQICFTQGIMSINNTWKL